MAATDQTYRKLKALHIVFGVSCLLMLVSVIWMFVQDFNKEYKPIQSENSTRSKNRAIWRAMLQQLPRGEDLQEKINNAEAARQEYAKAQTDMRAEEKKYSAQREMKNTHFQTVKASYDSQGSLLDIAVDEAGKETDPRRKATPAEEIENAMKEELTTLQATNMADAQNELDKVR